MGGGGSGLGETFDMFSGGRAIAENLALDRDLILAGAGKGDEVALADIEGISVKAIDWEARLPGQPVEVDALAMALPLDQHALFVPSVSRLFDLIELIEEEGAPLFQLGDGRHAFRELPRSYLKQLGLDDLEALKTLPVKSIAITGGDPFFPSGTDVAVLLEFEDGPERQARIDGFVELLGSLRPTAKTLKLAGAVAVSNADAQIGRLKAVQSGESPSLGSSEEFHFFRHRYSLQAAAETESAFVFLSDATIRRWGGPRLRIAASRRTRAIAALGDLTARHLAGEELGDDYEPLLGKVTADQSGRVQSEVFGSLGSITPVSELKFETVTGTEKVAYENWRRGYESGWARVFDPIAIRFGFGEGQRGLDVTILPLTIDSDYRQWLDIAGKANLSAMARNAPGEALLFASFAVDSQSKPFEEFDTELLGLLPGLKVNPLAWVGESISVYVEDGFFWKAVQHSRRSGAEISGDNISQLPIGIRVESKSSIKLALFLGALKGLAETSSPDLLRWETRKHGEKSYVAVIGNGDAIGADIVLYYATTPKALLLSLDEGILKRAIDRESVAGELDAGALPEAKHAMLKASPQFLSLLAEIGDGETLGERRRLASWRALPVLNEWHRRNHDLPPAEFHRLLFGENVACPGGKAYQWNAEAMTMESVAFGYPAAPRDEPVALALMEHFDAITAGIGFEDGGLRLTMKVEKEAVLGEVGAGADPLADGEQLATAAELTPTRPGSSHRYQWTLPEGTATESIEVLAPGKSGGRQTLRSKSTWREEGEEPVVTTMREILDGGLLFIGEDSAQGHMRYSEPFLELPEILIKGEASRGEYAFEAVEEGEAYSGIGDIEIRVVGLETVVVAAGSFEDCIRVESTDHHSSDGQISVSKEVRWFAKGVGLVKSETEFAGDRTVGELVEYQIPAE